MILAKCVFPDGRVVFLDRRRVYERGDGQCFYYVCWGDEVDGRIYHERVDVGVNMADSVAMFVRKVAEFLS